MAPLALPDEMKEAWCDRFAAAALMPRNAFIRSAASCNLRLPILSRFWRHCSSEAIITRVADLFPGCSASSWRGSRRRFRRQHEDSGATPLLEELEAFVASEAITTGRESHHAESTIAVRAWPASGDRAMVIGAAA